MPRPAPPRGLDELTDRELGVFRLIARGLSNPEIARELYISETTVKTHITHILQKLNLRDRVQAVVLATRPGFSMMRGPRPIAQPPPAHERVRGVDMGHGRRLHRGRLQTGQLNTSDSTAQRAET